MAMAGKSAIELGFSFPGLWLFEIVQCANAARCQKLLGCPESLAPEISGPFIHGHRQSHLQRAQRWRENRTRCDGSGLLLPFGAKKTGSTLHLTNHLPERGQWF